MSVVHPVTTNPVILIAVIQYILWFDVLVVIVAFIKRNRMAEALHTVWRKQSHRIVDILELVKGYITNYNNFRERLNPQYHKQRFQTGLQDSFFDDKSCLYTSQVSMRITEDNKQNILVKSSTR